MSWNYRIVHTQPSTEGDGGFSIHEVYYDDGVPQSWTIRPVAPQGADLMTFLQMVGQAFAKPILYEQDNKLVEEPDA